MKNGHRRMRAYGEAEHGVHFILDHYSWSRNNSNAVEAGPEEKGAGKEPRRHVPRNAGSRLKWEPGKIQARLHFPVSYRKIARIASGMCKITHTKIWTGNWLY